MKKIPRTRATARRSLPSSAAFTFVAVLAATGCSSGSGTSSGVDAGHDLGSTQDTGGGSCPARPDLAAAAPVCTNLASSAAKVALTMAPGTAASPTGGAILDGLYESTKTVAYGGAPGGGRRITFVITGGAARMFWIGEVLDAAGMAVQTTFTADTNISVAGTTVSFDTTCVSSSSGASPLPASVEYSVLGSDLVFSLANGSAATTYTRHGCAL